MGLNKYKGFVGGEALPAENVNSIDPENVQPLASGFLTGGTNPSSLAVFQALAGSGGAGNIKANIDGSIYDDVAVIPAYNFLNFAYASKNKVLSTNDGVAFSAGNACLSSDGLKVFYVWRSSNNNTCRVRYRNLSTAWDISTAGAEQSGIDIGGVYTAGGISFNASGTLMFISTMLSSNCVVYKYTLSTAWLLSSASLTQTLQNSGLIGDQGGGHFVSDDGTKLYLNSRIGGVWRVRQFNLSTAWDISTASNSGKYQTYLPFWYDNGTKALVNDTNLIDIYDASTAWDISTLTNSGDSINASSGTGSIFLNATKTKLYLGNTTLYQYDNGITIVSMNDVASAVQNAIRARTGKTENCVYSTDKFIITSSIQGSSSKVLKLMTPTNGTDMSGAGATPYLDCASNATETLGTGDDFNLVRLDPYGKLPREIFQAKNYSIADQVIPATTRTYITGSMLQIPSLLKVGTMLRWKFSMTKTGAGSASSTIDICFGTAGTTADTARVSFTKPAGTAVVDEAWVEIYATVRSIGASGFVIGEFKLAHNLASTGHATVPNVVLNSLSASFDMTVPLLKAGICITTGASDAITIKMVQAEIFQE